MAASNKKKTRVDSAIVPNYKTMRKKASNVMKMGRKKKEEIENKTEVEVFRAVVHIMFLPSEQLPIQTRQPSGLQSTKRNGPVSINDLLVQ